MFFDLGTIIQEDKFINVKYIYHPNCLKNILDMTLKLPRTKLCDTQLILLDVQLPKLV